jgi:hypothetical protein
MKSDARKKLVLHKETLRALKVKTGIKAGAASNKPIFYNTTRG